MSLRQKSLLSIHPGVKWEILPAKRKMIVVWMVRGYIIGAIYRYLHMYAFIVSKNYWFSLSREIFLKLVDTFIPFSKYFYFFSARHTHIFTFTEIWQQFLTAFLTLEGITFCCICIFFKRVWWFWNLGGYVIGRSFFFLGNIHRY